jgi:hypothetical protein
LENNMVRYQILREKIWSRELCFTLWILAEISITIYYLWLFCKECVRQLWEPPFQYQFWFCSKSSSLKLQKFNHPFALLTREHKGAQS